MKPLPIAFLLGLASACGFAPLQLWPLTLLAFVGLIWLIARAHSLRSALARGYWFGTGQFVLGLNWIATAFTYQSAMPHWLGWIAVGLLSLYLAVYPAMATGLAWRFRQRRGGLAEAAPTHSSRAKSRGVGGEAITEPRPLTSAQSAEVHPERLPRQAVEGLGTSEVGFVLIFAAAWIVTEWLRATMFTGFAWNPVGVALLPTPIARVATLVGTYGLSGVTLLLAGALYLLFMGKGKASAGWTMVSASALLVPVAVILEPRPLSESGVAMRIVQPNIGQQDKWTDGFEARNFARLEQLTGPPTAAPRLILWPEAAITDPLQDGRARALPQIEAELTRQKIARLLGTGDLLITGGVTFRSADGQRLTSATNSIFAMNARADILGRYDKAHLVPYGEYLPARPILSRLGLSRLAPGDVDFDPGPGPRTLRLPLVGDVGFQLCYEIIFSGEVVDPAHRPAWIFNPSNDAWFGAWGPPQHLAQARLRALEEGLPILRSTPTGISAVIDSNGELLHSLPWRVPGVIDAALPAPRPPTVFARLGNVAPFIFAGLLVLIGVIVTRRRKPVADTR